jgi:hypothetical protein
MTEAAAKQLESENNSQSKLHLNRRFGGGLWADVAPRVCQVWLRCMTANSARVQVAAPAVTRSALNIALGATPSSVGPERGSVSPRKMSSGARVGFT